MDILDPVTGKTVTVATKPSGQSKPRETATQQSQAFCVPSPCIFSCLLKDLGPTLVRHIGRANRLWCNCAFELHRVLPPQGTPS